jgi:hypothetical protein
MRLISLKLFTVLPELVAAAGHVTSLGSSYAYGPGLESTTNYGAIFANNIGASHSRLAVSGTTLIQAIRSQVPKIPQGTTVVTITSGGNDLGYIGSVMASAKDPRAKTWSSPNGLRARDISMRYSNVIQNIRERLSTIDAPPGTKIMLVNYIRLFGNKTVTGDATVPFSASALAHHESVYQLLVDGSVEAYHNMSSGSQNLRYPVVLVPMEAHSIGHAIGDVRAWVIGNGGGQADGYPWHPSAAGMSGVANCVSRYFYQS